MSEAWKYPIDSIGFKIADTVPDLTVDQIDRLILMLDEERPPKRRLDDVHESGFASGWTAGEQAGHDKAIADVKKLVPNPEPHHLDRRLRQLRAAELEVSARIEDGDPILFVCGKGPVDWTCHKALAVTSDGNAAAACSSKGGAGRAMLVRDHEKPYVRPCHVCWTDADLVRLFARESRSAS